MPACAAVKQGDKPRKSPAPPPADERGRKTQAGHKKPKNHDNDQPICRRHFTSGIGGYREYDEGEKQFKFGNFLSHNTSPDGFCYWLRKYLLKIIRSQTHCLPINPIVAIANRRPVCKFKGRTGIIPWSFEKETTMFINCPHCLHKAQITSRNNLNEEKTIADLYCNCQNPDCAARFVMQLGFQRWISTPVSSTLQLAVNLLKTLPKIERDKLLLGLSGK